MQHYIEEIQIFGERYSWRLYQMISQRIIIENNWRIINCMKSVRVWSFSGPYFPAFGMNTEKYGVSLSIQSKCGEIRTRKPDTFHTVINTLIYTTKFDFFSLLLKMKIKACFLLQCTSVYFNLIIAKLLSIIITILSYRKQKSFIISK